MAYENPKGIIAMSIILELLATGAVALRFVARRIKSATLLADDWLCAAALVGCEAIRRKSVSNLGEGAFDWSMCNLHLWEASKRPLTTYISDLY